MKSLLILTCLTLAFPVAEAESLWNRAAKRIGPFSFHCWRVYANTQMTAGEVDIIDRERILGHENRRTQAAYTAPEIKRYKAAVDTIR